MLYEIVLIEVMVNPPQGQDSGGERGGVPNVPVGLSLWTTAN